MSYRAKTVYNRYQSHQKFIFAGAISPHLAVQFFLCLVHVLRFGVYCSLPRERLARSKGFARDDDNNRIGKVVVVIVIAMMMVLLLCVV